MSAVVEGLAVLLARAVGLAVVCHLHRRDERDLREADELLAEYLATLPEETRTRLEAVADDHVERLLRRHARGDPTG